MEGRGHDPAPARAPPLGLPALVGAPPLLEGLTSPSGSQPGSQPDSRPGTSRMSESSTEDLGAVVAGHSSGVKRMGTETPPSSEASPQSSRSPAPIGPEKILKWSWITFCEADEVDTAVQAYYKLREACHVPGDASGSDAFDSILLATSTHKVPRDFKTFMHNLASTCARQEHICSEKRKVLISGAGPNGLRAAVEAAMMGMDVTLVERRDTFSRVNALILWQQTADDLANLGARQMCKRFSNNDANMHLGTRQIQLTLLKTSLLLGVNLLYGTEFIAVRAPSADDEEGRWHALTLPAAAAIATGILDFKPNKQSEYHKVKGMGKFNFMQASELDPTFALTADAPLPEAASYLASEAMPDPTEAIPFDAMIISEGEWSLSCKRLGITKSVDKFAQAIGMVINMRFDEHDRKIQRKELQSYTFKPFEETGRRIYAHGIKFELGKYLKGETHFIVLTMKKESLLEKGALRKDLPGTSLLEASNLDEGKLMEVARKVATCVGLPEHTAFCDFHPVKLFDFSSRARCLVGYRCVGVRPAGTQGAEEVVGADLELHEALREAETSWLERELSSARGILSGLEQQQLQLSNERAQAEQALSQGVEELDLQGCGKDVQELVKDHLSHVRNTSQAVHAKLKAARDRAQAAQQRLDEWNNKLINAHGLKHIIPIFPVGDSLIEPFWPEGLGCNRGFHTALDAVWAIYTLSEEGLGAALLERQFWFDVTLQGPWNSAIAKPAEGWLADPVTRYSDEAIIFMRRLYSTPSAKRLFKGAALVPSRLNDD